MANKTLDDMLNKTGASDNIETESFTEITPDEAEDLTGGVAEPNNTGCPVYNTGCPPK
jgi:hypothetical protein